MTHKQIIKELEKHKAKIGAERDKLRELTYELIDLKENCNSAYTDIQNAIDTLSQLT